MTRKDAPLKVATTSTLWIGAD